MRQLLKELPLFSSLPSDILQMILAEVHAFRKSVRTPQQVPYGQGQQGQQGQQQVPMPAEGFDARSYEDPRPQEMAARMQPGADLERELQGGLDAMRH